MGRTVEYEIREYHCGYCKFGPFEEATRKILGNHNVGQDKSKKGSGSNMVRCPKCGNFQKILEGKLLRTEKANSRF